MNVKEDLKQIDALHLKDMQASRAGDFKTLRSLLSDDAVIIAPNADPVQGKETHDKNFAAMQQSGSPIEVLSYSIKMEEIRVLEDFAFEWGTIHGSSRDKNTGVITESKKNVMRILRKENGEWKVFRSIWNDGKKDS
jgi:ketosteroid isomerase-like protein